MRDYIKTIITVMGILFSLSVYGQGACIVDHINISQKGRPFITLPVQSIDSIWFSSSKEDYLDSSVVYTSYVRKPVTFERTKVAFFGDSIMKGYINGYDITTDNIPNLLDSIYSFVTCDNLAVSASTFVADDRNVKTILEQVKECPLDEYDVVIIAGGINDWALGNSVETFIDAITSCVDYINKTSNRCKVIFITPIDCAALVYGAHPIVSLQIYRNIITAVVLKNDVSSRFSIIQGNEFGFPCFDSTNEYKNLMFGDMLHPSELGFRTLYLSGIIKAVN